MTARLIRGAAITAARRGDYLPGNGWPESNTIFSNKHILSHGL
jgi:hypothetical protein